MDSAHRLGALIIEAKSGNAAAFRAVYDQLADRVFLYVRSRAHSRDDALDVMQDTFVDFWRQLGSFDYESDGQTIAYLYTIASRKLSRLYAGKRATVDLDDIADLVRDPEDAEARSEAAEVVTTLGELADADREVIELRYFAGLSFGEIGALVRQSENAVKVRHHRTIQRLKKLLGYE